MMCEVIGGRGVVRRSALGTKVLATTVLLLAAWAVGAGAAAVSPMAVYIDSRTRTGTVTLFNPGDLPEEIDIGFAFGYPTSDEAGNVGVTFIESPGAGEPNAVPWLRAFPRRFVLEPGARQVVRIMVQPPAGLADGEYWARALIHSRGGQAAVEERRGDVTVQVNVETVVVAAVNYRHGEVATGLDVTGAEARREAGSVVATVDLRRTGNAAFLGRILAEVVDARGEVVASTEDVLAVYHTIRRRVELDVPADVRGPLEFRFRMDAERDDLPANGPLPVDPVIHTIPIV